MSTNASNGRIWRLTGAIESLNLGDERMIRLFEEMQAEMARMISNARNIRRVVVRHAMMKFPIAQRLKFAVVVFFARSRKEGK